MTETPRPRLLAESTFRVGDHAAETITPNENDGFQSLIIDCSCGAEGRIPTGADEPAAIKRWLSAHTPVGLS